MSKATRTQEIVMYLDTPYNRQLIAEGKLSKETPLFSERQVNDVYLSFRSNPFVDEVSYALHKNDKHKETKGQYHEGDKKADHAHMPVLYMDDFAQSFAYTARVVVDTTGNKAFKDNFVQASQIKGNVDAKYKYAVMVVYLAHENKAGSGRLDVPHFEGCRGNWDWDKYTWLYPRKDVHIAHSAFDKWEKLAKAFYDGSAKRKEKEAKKERELKILNEIANGTIKEYEIDEKVELEDLLEIDRKIPVAIRKANALMEKKAREEGFYKPNIWIWGKSGIAKTTLAEEYCKKHGLSYYIADAGNNPLDNYQGQEVIIFDDYRDCVYNFSTFLRVTNVNAPCRVPARYRNKVLANCKLMIFTSTIAPSLLYGARTDGAGEERVQLDRRLTILVHMEAENITTYLWNSKTRKHEPFERGKYVFDPDTYFAEKKNLVRDTFQGNPYDFLDDLKHMTDFWTDVERVEAEPQEKTEESVATAAAVINPEFTDACEEMDTILAQYPNVPRTAPELSRYWEKRLEGTLTLADMPWLSVEMYKLAHPLVE